MKRLLILLALCVVPVAASATELLDRDVLLTPDGVLYTVGTVRDDSVPAGRSPYYLTLTVQEGESRSTAPVPASLQGGAHSSPALAYDRDSRTLFLFWQETQNILSSRLLFASLNDGVWSNVSELDSVDWKLRRNLRIAVTRTIEATNERNDRVQVPQVVVHAVWWEESGYGEFARYAMLGVDNGIVTSKEFRYLLEFNGASIDQTSNVATGTPNEVLRHPAVSTTTTRDSVAVVFGDASANTMHRLRIRPILDGRVRIPIGVRGRNMRDMQLNMAAGARAAALIDDDTVTIYTVSGQRVDYAVYRNGLWSQQRSISLNDEVSAATAIDALRRMAAQQ